MVFNKTRLIKFLFFILILSLGLNAEQVEVTADNFFADEIKLESVLTGNVKMKKGSFDTLNSDKFFIYFDKDKNPLKYKATGNARFNIMINNSEYKGKGDILTYDPNTNIYTLEGNAYINEITTKREVFGDKITISQDNGKYEVESSRSSKNPSKKPARLIFQIEDKG
ncbi:lipooligosaccharide transport system, periplasmic component LptA [Campylobacter blaseri]|uniref:Lipopolysaccharide transport periplasmic protein LptA n=1 Tax=Campylobacter blaseri TaxID=2042961 RepID=A0A2P8R004_9BACT|nr:LptA/OstA family protein [Campylobacter blaseri]PSM51826.1 lipopolysaccharide transport periplasmic protein LptA [Campylobacter blaseri]PSM53617.1 lipopolysaccharide transport periplasmic protein LptA [Campylobacter blaseri]QKF86431.1 lipooligosaccharide transport system, periplasmic component LptA [Campylobacter blaseri]